MRKGEILNLQWSQVDFKNRTIRVEKTKSGKVRYVPMNDAVFSELYNSDRGQTVFVFANPLKFTGVKMGRLAGFEPAT